MLQNVYTNMQLVYACVHTCMMMYVHYPCVAYECLGIYLLGEFCKCENKKLKKKICETCCIGFMVVLYGKSDSYVI